MFIIAIIAVKLCYFPRRYQYHRRFHQSIRYRNLYHVAVKMISARIGLSCIDVCIFLSMLFFFIFSLLPGINVPFDLDHEIPV